MKPRRQEQTGSICPCGTARRLSDCCGRYHAGEAAPDAAALMRSRYSAYVLRERNYLLRTWHPRTRPGAVELDEHTRWLGLDVLEHHVVAPDQAEVSFVARYRLGGGSAVRMRERSRFVREGGQWLYVDGDVS